MGEGRRVARFTLSESRFVSFVFLASREAERLIFSRFLLQ